MSFFAVPKGQSATLLSTFAVPQTWTAAAKGKTYRDTNIENANVVPTKLFKTVGISWGMFHSVINSATNPTDREVIRQGGFLQFRIVDKDIIFLPLSLIPEVNPLVATTVNAANAYAGGGGQNVPMYKFPIPITLNPYENFLVLLQFDNSPPINTTLDLQCVLHAYMRKQQLRLIVVIRLANPEYRGKPEMVIPRHSRDNKRKVVTTTKGHLALAV